jgi:hypothetical protein
MWFTRMVLLLAADLDFHGAADAQRGCLLRNLEVLGHVRIEVVLPVERAPQRNPRADHQPHLDGLADGLAVHRRQRPRQPEADRQTATFGVPSSCAGHAQNIFVRVFSCTCTSKPMEGM